MNLCLYLSIYIYICIHVYVYVYLGMLGCILGVVPLGLWGVLGAPSKEPLEDQGHEGLRMCGVYWGNYLLGGTPHGSMNVEKAALHRSHKAFRTAFRMMMNIEVNISLHANTCICTCIVSVRTSMPTNIYAKYA